MKCSIGVTLVALALGCGGEKKENEAGDRGAAEAAETAPADGEGEPDQAEPVGLAHPDSHPDVVTLAKAALECEWSDRSGLDSKCEAMQAWKEQRDAERLATFTELLRDPDEKARWLGARAISVTAMYVRDARVHDDPDVARAILAAVRAEDSEAAALLSALGAVAGRVDAEKLGLLDELRAIVEDHAIVELRLEVLGTMRTRNLGKGEAAMLFELARSESSDAKIRLKAIDALRNEIAPDQAEAMCGYFGEAAAGTDINLAAHAAVALATDIDCKPHVGALLDALEERATEGRARHSQLVEALREVHRHRWSEKAHAERAVAIARAILDNAANERDPESDFVNDPRARALRFLIEDAGAKPALAAKFTEDENRALRRAAEKLVSKKKR